ncbi:Cof-type HAD-IIB family hydrolase [Companilactobacillus mishanensis]|uniref:Cof-type HAD-IIB family hydrolase n=1 Tax=Companilactobacillus mishanensis TaxID=2486008 RepID=UPI001295E14C|nr:Cof-type HAD-IIB family hydrolase [Companilactobacillus mishanensis]MQS88418.1 HAD family phosphatase [Companilactobacillus mishanensis]
MIKFIGTDLDGTLLNSHSQISEENSVAIRKAVNAGITYAICSGRTLQSVKGFFENDLKTNGYMVLLNGAVIFDPDGNKISDRPMATSVVDEMLMRSERDGFKVVLDGLDSTYVTDPELSGATYYEGVSKYNVLMNSVADLRKLNEKPDFPIYKVCFSAHPDKLSELKKKIESFTSLPVVISRSGASYYEINALDVTKMSALQRISAVTEIPITDFMCFGDYGNDLDMLKGVGFGVAMDNAISEVKESADYVTKTNDQNGVAWMIDKVLKNEIV